LRFCRIIFAALASWCACFADVQSGKPGLPHKQPDIRSATSQYDQAEKDYWRGVEFEEGDAVEQDYEAAARWYRQAADSGFAPAQYNLAKLYQRGLGVEQNLERAALWYRKAAEQGDGEAQNNLGVLYATGQGVAHDDGEAVRWYRLAAEQDDPEGTTNLGTMYLQGRAVERDFAQAFQLFRKAAEQGHAVAQNNLALMYANGQSVPRDYAWAYAWLDLATERISGCAELRDRIGKEMTSDEMTRARDLSRQKRAEFAQKGKTPK